MSSEKPGQTKWKPTWSDYVVSIAGGLCFVGQVVLCFTSYNWLNADRVLYLGWTILAFALLLGISARRELPAQTESSDVNFAALTSGLYGIIRHPIYVSFMMVLFSMILISQHWLSAILGLPWMVYLYLSMFGEDYANIQDLGDIYRQYMREVPRANLLVGLIRHFQRKDNSNP